MKKLDYIDGLKGIGALMVFFCHFVFAFYYAAYSLTGDAVNTNSGIEITIGKTPLNLLYSGNSAVCLFLVFSYPNLSENTQFISRSSMSLTQPQKVVISGVTVSRLTRWLEKMMQFWR